MKTKLLSIILMFILSSCYFTHYLPTNGVTFMETNPGEIQIFARDIDQDYTIIGSVAAEVIGNGDKALRHLKNKSAKLGADAIINIELNKINASSPYTGISGVAIKMKAFSSNLSDN